MVVDLGVLGHSCRSLHNTDCFIIVTLERVNSSPDDILKNDVLVSKLHFSPLAPNLGKIFHGLEVDLSRLLQYLASTVEVLLRLTGCSTFFIEFGKVDIKSMKVRGCLARTDCRKSGSVGLYHLVNSLGTHRDIPKLAYLLVIVSP